MIEFFRELFQLMDERKKCKFCEELKVLLENEKNEKRRLLDFILTLDNEKEEVTKELPIPIRPKHIPWHIQRELLEQEDRKRAQLMRETEKLEKELLQEKE